MKIIAVTQKGSNKSENEDRVVIGRSILADGGLCTEMDEGVIAIADGVGGHSAGAFAAHFVSERLCAMREISAEQLQEINGELIKISGADEHLAGTATTLSGICISDREVQLFSIGNTRVYLLQSRKYLKQLTSDDTTLHYLLATGRLAPEDAGRFDRKNEITACFGGGSSELFKIKVRSIEPSAAPIMITSDGIHDYLTVDQMENIIEACGFSETACAELIKAARANGSSDDASVILGEV